MNYINPIKEKQEKKNYNSLVKHNNLIQGKYSLEASEQKLLYKIFEELQKKNYSTRIIPIDFKVMFEEYSAVLGKKISKRDLLTLFESLQDKKPYIIKNDSYIRTQWYSIQGKLDMSEITLKVDEDVFEYVQSLDKNFTGLRLDSLYAFKSFYSMRIYELIKQWSKTKSEIPYKLQTLKELLGVEVRTEIVKGVEKEVNKSYNNFNNFDKYILKKAVEEINAKSEIKVTYQPVKEGRKVEGVLFYVEDNTTRVYSTMPEQQPPEAPGKPVDVPSEDAEPRVIPEELSLDSKLHSIFARQFQQYDFTDIDFLTELLEAESVALKKTKYTTISAPIYKLFATILKNKLDDLMERRKKESESSAYSGLTFEQREEAELLGMTATEYLKFIEEV